MEAINLVFTPLVDDHPYAEVIGRISHGVFIHGGIKFSFTPRDYNLVAD